LSEPLSISLSDKKIIFFSFIAPAANSLVTIFNNLLNCLLQYSNIIAYCQVNSPNSDRIFLSISTLTLYNNYINSGSGLIITNGDIFIIKFQEVKEICLLT